MSEKQKLNVKQTFLIGFGLFSFSVCGAVYNAYVPLILKEHVNNAILLGFVMAVDNIFAALLQPVFGRLSDKTHTKIGKRMPYIIVGAPLGAILFILIPYTNSLLTTMGVVIAYNFVMMAWHVPAISLMPDLTPSGLRSQANGIINVMGGLGNVVAFLFGGILFNIAGMPMPFLVSGIAMIISTVIMFFFVKETPGGRRRRKDSISEETGERQESRIFAGAVAKGRAAQEEQAATYTAAGSREAWENADVCESGKKPRQKIRLGKQEWISLVCLIAAIFLWGFGFNATETFFTLYAVDKIPGFTAGDASMVLTAFPLAFLVMAVPAGLLAGKIGRRKCICIGLGIDIVCFASVYFLNDFRTVIAAFVIGGMAWAFVNVNSLPMVLEIGGKEQIGLFTACYYFFSDPAYIISPIAFGLVYEITRDYSNVFAFTTISFILALVCMLFVRHGESAKED